MNVQQPQVNMLSPKRVKEKADILETNLYKDISKQTNPSRVEISINRATYPDAVITKSILQLFPRFNIKPRPYLLPLRDLLQKQIPEDETESFEADLDVSDEETDYDDYSSLTRVIQITATMAELRIIINGVSEKPSIDGEIGKSFFDYQLSPGKMHKDGIIDFKEINKFPIVNAGDKLFYITHEIQGTPGLSFEGKTILVQEAKAYPINHSEGVEKVEDIDIKGDSKGYYLVSKNTGVVLLERNKNKQVTGISISSEIDIDKLDYSTGNIGTRYTCPVQMKVGIIRNGFKIRVNGKVEAEFVDGGEIITNNEAIISKAQTGSSILALKDVTINAAIHSKIISEQGRITIRNELIDSSVSAPKVNFDESKGLATNTKIEAEKLSMKGCYFSGENIIYFGNNLFAEEKEQTKNLEKIKADQLALENNEKLLMGQLQLELKRLTKLVNTTPDLINHIKPLIMATKTMNFEIINREMEALQKRNNTKVVINVKKIFNTLEKIPDAIEDCKKKVANANEIIEKSRQKMPLMKLSIEGYLRRGATVKVFCGIYDKDEKIEPDFFIECEGDKERFVTVTGAYSAKDGFEFVQ